MTITVIQLPGYLRRLSATLAAEAPVRACHAMGDAYTRVVVESMGGDSPSPPGTPPARVTGTLARSVRATPAVRSGPYTATCSVAPHTVYARIQQLGGHIYPKHDAGVGREGTPRTGLTDKGHFYMPAARAYATGASGRLGYLRWQSAAGVRFSQHVYLPPRPYMVMSEEARTACHDAAAQAVSALLKSAE